jgi:rhodanese-related sulfurtransferase
MPKTVDRNEVQQMLTRGAQLVEVLSAKQYKEAHLPGAVNLPLEKLNQLSAAKLDNTTPIIVYCYDYQ